MIPGGSTDTDTTIVDWGDGTCTMVIGSGLNPLFVRTYNVPVSCIMGMSASPDSDEDEDEDEEKEYQEFHKFLDEIFGGYK